VARDDRLTLSAVAVSPDGKRLVRALVEGPRQDPQALGHSAAAKLLQQGAQSIIDAAANVT
jgi:porphobilinogen deaminase